MAHAEQIAAFAGARVVVGQHGAGLCLSVAHAVFSGTRASNAFVCPSYWRWRAALR
jgi:capsular polysaccharide biosynthesis protein